MKYLFLHNAQPLHMWHACHVLILYYCFSFFAQMCDSNTNLVDFGSSMTVQYRHILFDLILSIFSCLTVG